MARFLTGLAALLVISGGALWLFRYEYLPPIAHRWDQGGETVVVCSIDRLDREVFCSRELVIDPARVREFSDWLGRQPSPEKK